MRHGKKVRKLGRKKAHRSALLKNMCRALFVHEQIRTTLHKAKEARRLAERLIEFAKRNDLAAKRYIYRFIPDHKLVQIVCADIAPRFAERRGGYTRIYRLGPRLGDGAEMAILELIEKSDEAALDNRRKLIERRHAVEEKSGKERPKKEKEPKKKKEEPKKEKAPKAAEDSDRGWDKGKKQKDKEEKQKSVKKK